MRTMLHKLTLRDLGLNHKKVLMRVDFNVPFKKDGSIADDTRIREAIPSIRYVLQHGGSLILMGHLGRPKGKFDAKASLAPCAKRLSELLGQPVEMASDCIGPSVEKLARSLKQGNVAPMHQQLSSRAIFQVNRPWANSLKKNSLSYRPCSHTPNAPST